MDTLRTLWGHADFRRLWLGQSLSEVGNRMTTVVIAMYVLHLTGSTGAVGAVLAAEAVATTLALPFGGVIADRVPRRRVMIATDLVRLAAQGAIAVLAFTTAPPVWLIALLVAATGAAGGFFQPAYRGLLPQTIPEDLIQEAQTVSQVSRNLALLVGPAVGAVLAVSAGFGWAYVVDAGTFAASAALLVGVRARARGEARDRAQTPSLRRDLAEGLGEVTSRPWVWVTVLWTLGWVMLCLAPYFALGAAVGRDLYDDTRMFGWMEAAAGAGAVAGVVGGFRWRPARPMLAALCTPAGWLTALLLFAHGAPVWLVLPVMAVGGAMFTMFEVLWTTSLTRFIPPHAISRVSAWCWIVPSAAMPLGFAAAGALGARMEPATVLTAATLAGAATTLAALASPGVRTLRDPRRTPAPEVVPEA
ncbi:MAG: MFS transporter [Thermoleophilia bacterium]